MEIIDLAKGARIFPSLATEDSSLHKPLSRPTKRLAVVFPEHIRCTPTHTFNTSNNIGHTPIGTPGVWTCWNKKYTDLQGPESGTGSPRVCCALWINAENVEKQKENTKPGYTPAAPHILVCACIYNSNVTPPPSSPLATVPPTTVPFSHLLKPLSF